LANQIKSARDEISEI